MRMVCVSFALYFLPTFQLLENTNIALIVLMLVRMDYSTYHHVAKRRSNGFIDIVSLSNDKLLEKVTNKSITNKLSI